MDIIGEWMHGYHIEEIASKRRMSVKEVQCHLCEHGYGPPRWRQEICGMEEPDETARDRAVLEKV